MLSTLFWFLLIFPLFLIFESVAYCVSFVSNCPEVNRFIHSLLIYYIYQGYRNFEIGVFWGHPRRFVFDKSGTIKDIPIQHSKNSLNPSTKDFIKTFLIFRLALAYPYIPDIKHYTHVMVLLYLLCYYKYSSFYSLLNFKLEI